MPTDTLIAIPRQALPGRSRIFTSLSSQQANAPRTRTARPRDARNASFLLAAALLIGLPLAATAATPQQQRMADCSAKNKGLKGDAYKTAQSACLSGHATDTKAATPQERMKQCNADAATKKLAGDARKTFMSSCLKAS